MYQTLNRRQFIQSSGAIAAAAGLLLLQQGTTGATTATEGSATELLDIEQWLLGTANDDLEAELLALVSGTTATRLFLPIIRQ